MKHRLLTLMVAGLFAAGTASAQSSNGQLCDPAKARQFISLHPEYSSSFVADRANGQMICTDAKVFELFSNEPAMGTSAQPSKAGAARSAAPSTLAPAKGAQLSTAAGQAEPKSTHALSRAATQLSSDAQKTDAQQKEATSKTAGQPAGVDRVAAMNARSTAPARTATPAPATTKAAAPARTATLPPAPKPAPMYTPETSARIYELEVLIKEHPEQRDQYQPELDELLKQRIVTTKKASK